MKEGGRSHPRPPHPAHLSAWLMRTKPISPLLWPGLSCYAQPFGYNGISWAWDLKEIAEQIMMTHRLADFWDATHPGR
jgi:hypothetical protein